ncbi:InlB B-repeat-containing protein, partial [Marinisporobacter balticus]
SKVGGLVGLNSSTIANGYYNTNAIQKVGSSIQMSIGIGQDNNSQTTTGRTSTEMQLQAFIDTLNTNRTGHDDWNEWIFVSDNYPTCIAMPTPAPTLTVTISEGTATGSTKADITETETSKFVVNITDSEVTTPNTSDAAPTSGDNRVDPYTSESNITTGVEENKYLQIYDVDANGKVAGFYQKQLAAGDIKPMSYWKDHVGGVSSLTGFGTEAEPYRISSGEELAFMAQEVNAGNADYNKAYYQLTQDIDLAAHQWTPIGDNSNMFEGKFDGKGHKISHVFIGTTNSLDNTYKYAGLFGYTIGNIKNTGVSVSIHSSYSSSAIGGIAGYNTGTIINSYAIGNLTGGNNARIGGLVGPNTGTIINSYAIGDVTGGTTAKLGGLVSYNSISGTINNSYATGDVTGASGANVGGLVGVNENGGTVTGYYNVNTDQTVDGSLQIATGIGSGTGAAYGIQAAEMAGSPGEVEGPLVNRLNTGRGSNSDWYFWQQDSAVNSGYPTLIIPPTYTVAFDSKGGSAVSDITDVSEDATITEPTAPTKSGYTFDDWYKEESYTNKWNFGTDTVTSDIILYAKWTEIPLSAPSAPEISLGGSGDGYATIQWDEVSGATGYIVYKDSMVVADAVYTVSDYVYSYHATGLNNGTQYAFKVKANNAGGESGFSNEINVTPSAAPPAITYTVAFDSQGGSTVHSIRNVSEDATITEPTAPTKSGYTFDDWYKEESYTNKWNFGTDTVTSDIILYAKWTEIPLSAPSAPEISLGGSGDGYATIQWDEVSGATGYIVYKDSMVVADAVYTVSDYVYSYHATGLNNGTQYAFKVKANNADGESGFSNEINVTPSTITYTVEFDSQGGSTVPNIRNVSEGGTITAPTASTRSGYTFDGWYKEASYTNKWNFGTDTVTSDITLYAKWVKKSSGDSSSGGGSSPTSQNKETGIKVIVNGQEQTAGKEIVKEEKGKKEVALIVNAEVVNKKIEEVIKEQLNLTDENKKEINNVIEIPVAYENADKITTALTGDIIKNMDAHEFKLLVKVKGLSYSIPAKEIGIEKVASRLGVKNESLKQIKVEVRIEKATEAIVDEITKKAKQNNYGIVAPPVEFKVVAKTTSENGEENEVEISKFSQYVERLIEIPEDIDSSKITTGIVYNLDGTLSHVPTDVYHTEQVYFARINSLTNSNYSVIWNPITVESVENHWSKESVNDMASRLIIKNPENFMPDEDITRADFAEYITKAIGVYRTQIAKEDQFSDVKVTDEFADGITAAVEYGIIKGYPDGTFKPNAKISREEAMVMYAKAIDIVQLKSTDEDRIESYKDKEEVSKWAYEAVKETLSAGVFNGRTNKEIVPKGTFTYAEAATAIRNLLIKANLINE